ncbi:MAG TPA: thioredoxin domain-containing protein [Bacteroidales bacterium]|nr:thioredoxin domain-containing protein [Bacteroidales bacterium]
MRKLVFILISVLIFISCNNNSADKEAKDETKKDTVIETVIVKPEVLNELVFKQKVFDYEKGKEWKYLGDKPCMIDFYADWCAPCRKLAPIIEELANEYQGKIQCYKINTDHNQNVSRYFNVSSIPAVLLCPMKGQPQMIVGLYPKQDYINAIHQVLLDTVSSNK